MRIQNQTNYNTAPANYIYQCKPNFTSNQRAIGDFGKKKFYRNTTWFFRVDLNWDKLTDKIIEKFKKADKVNIHCFACSEGAEPYSLAMHLIEKLGEKDAQKFFPILASDIDAKILKNPKRGIIKLSRIDLRNIQNQIDDHYSKYINLDYNFQNDRELNDYVCSGKVKPILKNMVVFKKADIFEEIKNVEKENSIVMCRNFWPYIEAKKQTELADALSQRLGESSMCILGEFDSGVNSKHIDVRPLLLSRGFTPSNVNYCLLKEPKKEKDFLSNPEFLKKTFVKKNK